MSSANNKTIETDASVENFLSSVKPGWKQQDARKICALMQTLSGCPPRMWGKTIIGFGQYHYRYDSGREGDFLRIGFSPRKQNFSLYCMSGFAGKDGLLSRLGKHKLGKSCLYINKLEDIDQVVLEEIIVADLANMAEKFPE